MANIAAAIVVAFIVAALVKLIMKYWSDLKFSKEFNAPGLPFPLIGHSNLLFNVNREDVLEVLLELSKSDPKGRKIGTVLGRQIIWYFHPEPIEEILSSNEHISKSKEYEPLLVSKFKVSAFY